MTKDEALKLALEALTNAYWPTEADLMPAHNIEECADAITAIKEALAQPEPWEKSCDSNCVWTDHHPDCKLAEQEPVAWLIDDDYTTVFHDIAKVHRRKGANVLPLYTTPPQRKPLTDEEIYTEARNHEKFAKDGREWFDRGSFARAIEAAHGIKGEKMMDVSNDGFFEKQNEPDKYAMDIECTKCGAKQSGVLTVHTTPPQRTWVGLTDEDIEQEFGFIDELLRDCVQRSEAKLKEKNT